MSVVTVAEAWPAAGRPFTVAELDRMPADGRRYELLDGVLIVSPRPTTIHQGLSRRKRDPAIAPGLGDAASWYVNRSDVSHLAEFF